METLDFSKLLRYAWVIVLAGIIGAFAALLYSATNSMTYLVQARLLVGPGIDSPRPDLNVLRASGQLIQTYAEFPLSEPFLQEIIDDFQLDMQPDELAKLLSVRPNPETQILTIEVQHSDASLTQAIAYRIAEKLVLISPSNPDSSAAQIREQMRSQVTELEQSVAQTRLSLQQMEADYQKAVSSDGQLKESAGSLAAISGQLDQFEKNDNLFADAASQSVTGIQVLEEIASNTNARIVQFEFELEKTTNPVTQNLLSEQIRLERTHLSNLRQVIADIKSPIEGVPLDQHILSIQKKIAELEQSLNRILNFDYRRLQFDQISLAQSMLTQARNIEMQRQEAIFKQFAAERERISDVELFRIENQHQILEQITLERSRLAEMQDTLALLYNTIQSADPNQVKIMELTKPTPITQPTSLMVLIGAFAGMVLSVMAILGSGYVFRNVETSEQVTNLFAVPAIDVDKDQVWTYTLFNRKQAIRKRLEMYQMLGMRLLYAHEEKERKIVLIGSVDTQTNPGIVAANLAVFLAQIGKRVILVDANIDRPSIADYFQLEQEEGLSDFLAGYIKKYLPITSIDQYPSLGLLPFGRALRDFTYLNTTQIVQQLDRLKDRVDLVLVAAPALLRPDSLALASNASGVILVAAKGKTSLNTMEEVVENLKLVGAKVLYAMLQSNAAANEKLDLSPIGVIHSSDDMANEALSFRSRISQENGEGIDSLTTPLAEQKNSRITYG